MHLGFLTIKPKIIMKKTFHILSLSVVSALSAVNLLAQTNAPAPTLPTSSGSFASSVQSYFTSFNTNLDSTFSTARGEFAVGVDSIQGGTVPLANSLRLSVNMPGTNWLSAFSLESVTRDGGVTGGIISEQVGLGINFVVHDAKLTLFADGGYNFDDAAHRGFAEVGVRVQKALTEHTFAGIGMGAILPGNSRVFTAFTGFTF